MNPRSEHEYLREVVNPGTPSEYTEVWHTPPPDRLCGYTVVDCEWNDDATERHIYRVDVL